MTPDQQKDHDRLNRYIARESLVPVMNNTKWKETILALQSVDGFWVQFRVKCLRDMQEPVGWDRSFPYHIPTPYRVIEWLEVNPVVTTRVGALVKPRQADFRAAIREALQRYSIPNEERDGAIRIYGYKRPSNSDS